jgi:hypothetical protein
MNWIKKLFISTKENALEKEIETLKLKLEERQEAINKTNAYWKKKMNEAQKKLSAK